MAASSSSRSVLRRELVRPDVDGINIKSEEGKRVAPVLYYLSRNGHLDHPHFMEVPLSSPPALFLKDVINRFNVLRGKGMASMYSWSCKRSYKNGFVWHDLSENDLVCAAHGHDYILKGSELPENVFLHVGSPPNIHRVEIEVSTPPSDSSPETLATLMKAGSHIQRCRSSVLMQMISCGSMPFKDCGPGERTGAQIDRIRVKLEEKDYFSGSFVDQLAKKQETPALRRSNSYNADRSLNLEVAAKGMERVRAKCLPTKTKAHSSTRKEGPPSFAI